MPDSAASSAVPGKKRPFFYGWYVVAAGFLGNVAYSEQFNASYGVFIYHIADELGWGRTVLAGVKSVGRVSEAVMAPFLGPILDRSGARWVMVFGAILSAVAFMWSATIDEIWELYLFQAVLAPLGGVCMGGFVVSITVSNWFVARRGRAVGFAAMGTSFGTMTLPLLASLMIENWGWRQTWFLMGLSILVLIVPAGLVMRRRPEDIGLLPDGADPDAPPGQAPRTEQERRRAALLAADVVWTRRQIIRSPILWIMVASWGFVQFTWSSTNLHMVPFFQDLGYSLVFAASAVSLRSACAFISNPIWGWLTERLPFRATASIMFASTAVGIGLWMLPPTTATLLLGIVFFGFGGGGGQVVSEVIWAGFFGRLSLGTVRGVSYPLQSVFAGIGPVAVGLLFDNFGSYQPAFVVMLVGCLIAGILIQFARPMQPAAARAL